MAVIFDNKNKVYYVDAKIKKQDGSIYHFTYKRKNDEKFKSKKYVKSIEQNLIKKKKEEILNDNKHSVLTLDDLFDRYTRAIENETARGTLKGYEWQYNKYIVRNFHNSLKEITDPNRLDAWRTELSNLPMAHTKTKNSIINIARKLIDYARKIKLIDSDTKDDCLYILEPFKQSPNENPKSKNQYTSIEEFNKIIDKCDSVLYRDVLTLLYFSGLRIGEFLGIKVSDIEFREKEQLAIVDIQRQRLMNGAVTTRLKTSASYKKIGYAGGIYKTLVEYIRRNELKETDYLIPMSREAIRSYLNRACKKAGVKNNTLHGFGRKSINTELYKAGADSKVRTTLLGQDSVSINEKNYIDKQETFEKGLEYIEKISPKIPNC